MKSSNSLTTAYRITLNHNTIEVLQRGQCYIDRRIMGRNRKSSLIRYLESES